MWDRGPIPPELTRFPGYLLARLGEASRRRFARALQGQNLHPRDFGVMTLIDSQPGSTQQQLHEMTGIDPSSMVAVIDELESVGLAERRPHPGDRRARTIYLTEQGKAALEQVQGLAAGLQEEMFAPLTREERRTLHDLLRKLAGAQGPPES
jgi:MarR family transcriptional regulator, lower aerobic nicotinate degradation pathway regulator